MDIRPHNAVHNYVITSWQDGSRSPLQGTFSRWPVLITVCHWTLFWATWIYSSSSHCYFRHILIKMILTSISGFPNCSLSFKLVDVCSTLCGLFLESRTTSYETPCYIILHILLVFLMSLMRSTCPAHLFPPAISAYINYEHVSPAVTISEVPSHQSRTGGGGAEG
jgi:hypothetical protein